MSYYYNSCNYLPYLNRPDRRIILSAAKSVLANQKKERSFLFVFSPIIISAYLYLSSYDVLSDLLFHPLFNTNTPSAFKVFAPMLKHFQMK